MAAADSNVKGLTPYIHWIYRVFRKIESLQGDALQAHNLKVVGSNPTPATTFTEHRYGSGTADPLGPADLFCAPKSTMAAISPISSISKLSLSQTPRVASRAGRRKRSGTKRSADLVLCDGERADRPNTGQTSSDIRSLERRSYNGHCA